jgi:Flp pilus assembly protein TadG
VSGNPNSAIRQIGATEPGWTLNRAMLREAFARFRDDSDGSQMVELAMILPVLMLMMVGVLTFGLTLNNYLELTQAANNAARQIAATRPVVTSTTLYPVTYNGTSYADPCAFAVGVLKSSAPTLNAANVTTTVTIGGTGYTSGTCSGADANLSQGGYATVSATYPYLTITINFPHPDTVVSSSFTATAGAVVQ